MSVISPPSIHLFFLWEHAITINEIAESLSLAFLHQHHQARYDEKKVAQLLAENNPVTLVGKEWLMRKCALRWGLTQCRDLAFACAILDEPMPPFEAVGSQKQRNWKARNAIPERFEQEVNDNPLVNRLARIGEAAEEGREIPAYGAP
jgi:hypothetical protein